MLKQKYMSKDRNLFKYLGVIIDSQLSFKGEESG